MNCIQGMERCIRASYGVGPIDPCIEAGSYELYTSNNAGILPAHWEKMIESGEVIAMRMLQPPQSLPTPPPQAPPPQAPPQALPQVPASNRPARPLARPRAPSVAKARPPVEKKKVKFISAAGKTYLLPFNICETWQVRNDLKFTEARELIYDDREWRNAFKNPVVPVLWTRTFRMATMNRWPR
jgi:hypothetical protein